LDNLKRKYKRIFPDTDSVASITEARYNQLTYCDKLGEEALDLIRKTKARFIIVSHDLDINYLQYDEKKILLYSNHPKLDFVKLASKYYPEEKEGLPNTVIDPSVRVGSNVSIGRKNVRIGENTVIHDNVVIYDNVHIGSDCIIQSGAVIGGDGFGYIQDVDLEWIRFPHYGKVIIKNKVEIGSNTCIDRGSLSDTIIEDGVKIDNLVHVAHNTKIGKNSLIIALAMIGGSTKIGENCWIAPSSSLKDNIRIGDQSIVGLGAVVLKDVPNLTVVVGNPARILRKND